MRQLRLVGIHENGEELLLSSDDGSGFALPIDEALRAALIRAARADRGTPEGSVLAPREIQTRIRSGSTAAQVAAESGMPLAHVMRYEGPVMAEREYVAQQARNVEVSAPQTHEGYRAVFGEEPANLGEMVAHRLHAFGIEASSLNWDAWRTNDGAWVVVAEFDLAAANDRTNIGSIDEDTQARWSFHPARKSLQNSNRWAQVLSELEPLDAPAAGRRLTAVADSPFDVDAGADDAGFEAAVADSEELLDVLRSRRGHRLGTDEDADDQLAMMLSRGPIPSAHPRSHDLDDELSGDEDFTLVDDPEELDGLPRLYDGVSTRTSHITVVPGPGARTVGHAEPSATRPADELIPDKSDDDGPVKKKLQRRSSVPSWDEIVFGRKND
ncbi:septation protein SepH [Paeniglutamicibacter cryotolerans]|uniref:DUF3071 domain-containing protein n=1 Tax=Paeniglutamicibacter cryotolerans TaxID=670079 RepID=A0A839QPI5_9MICC|nr:septation protein SepH [Paeniglutamicibacter cryotolerans]MBB2996684.1 hypothetical protein [Paeniglutamicibacter cryotolerans]